MLVFSLQNTAESIQGSANPLFYVSDTLMVGFSAHANMALNSSPPIQDNTSMAGNSNRLLAPHDCVGCSESLEQKENATTIPCTLGTSWISHFLISLRKAGKRQREAGGKGIIPCPQGVLQGVIRGFPSGFSFTDPNDILQPASQEQESLFRSRAEAAGNLIMTKDFLHMHPSLCHNSPL